MSVNTECFRVCRCLFHTQPPLWATNKCCLWSCNMKGKETRSTPWSWRPEQSAYQICKIHYLQWSPLTGICKNSFKTLFSTTMKLKENHQGGKTVKILILRTFHSQMLIFPFLPCLLKTQLRQKPPDSGLEGKRKSKTTSPSSSQTHHNLCWWTHLLAALQKSLRMQIAIIHRNWQN